MTYTNQYPDDMDAYNKLGHSEQLEVIRNLIKKEYPEQISGDELDIVADLMIRYDEDVVDIDGQFYPLSEVPNV